MENMEDSIEPTDITACPRLCMSGSNEVQWSVRLILISNWQKLVYVEKGEFIFSYSASPKFVISSALHKLDKYDVC